ncbi:matrilin-3-like [Hydractinia symbiolongicarpus]|uniref:matrilin-3-like n=1 Tax=Hydractinia symbiolongicarpus TaxID=13093 RepID=UPI002551353B|nr:matrilin-3-like [Hydractinia symbiolongicarpus]
MTDSSRSMMPKAYQKSLEFIASVTEAFDIQEEGTHVAVIQYATNARIIFDFNKFKGEAMSKEKVVDEIKKIPSSNGKSTRIDKALNLAFKVFSEKHGGRKGIPKIAILITDGLQSYTEDKPQPIKTSKKLQGTGVHVYTVGVGMEINKYDLKIMASDHNSTFIANDLKDLLKFAKKIPKKICEDVELISPTPKPTHKTTKNKGSVTEECPFDE